MINKNFWKGKKVFLTGHTGFKGSWLSLWLQKMDVQLKGYALKPLTQPALFDVANVSKNMISEIGDIRDFNQLHKSISDFQPEILIHMAAQPLVRESYLSPLETYEVNVMGTAKVLEACRDINSLKAIINVTTDKCYENHELSRGYREDEAMGGFDPYSSSKGCAELVTSAYRRSFFADNTSAGIASARAGNVIGGGDWAKDRLIPDILNAFQKSEEVLIRNPLSIRPWQFVLEPLSGYLTLAEKLFEDKLHYEGAWNFGPRDEDAKNVQYIVELLSKNWGAEASWKLDNNINPHEAKFLKLDISKAKQNLKWHPSWSLEIALEKIILWQKAYLQDMNMSEVCLSQIEEFESNFRGETD